MVVPWLSLVPVFGRQTITQIDDLVVKSFHVSYDPAGRVGIFRQGVVAMYGPTSITADELEVHQAEKYAEARGNVHLVDPDGTMTARNLRFSWDPESRTGQADDIVIDFAGVMMKAAHADLKPELWTLTDVYGTSRRTNPPVFDVRSPNLTLIPGRRGRIAKPRIDLLGRHLLTLPTQNFNLDPRVQGLRFPNISYRRGDGFGMNWDSAILLSQQSSIGASLFAYPHTRPSYSLQLAKSFVPAEKTRVLIAPQTDLSERFGFSYFENVELPTPRSDQNFLRAKRDGVSVGSHWFQGSANDISGAEYTKPLEVAYEKGGVFGDIGAVGQVRLQTIRRDLESIRTRGIATGSAGPRPIDLGPGLQGHLRLDAAAFMGSKSSGWLHGTAAATYQPWKPLTVTMAFRGSVVGGSAQYPIDELASANGATARFDLNAGPTQATLLWRYDSAKGWFDHQYYVSQIVGCIEPYMLYREYYGDYRIGVNIRLGNFVDVITRRQFERGIASRHVLDGPGRKQ